MKIIISLILGFSIVGGIYKLGHDNGYAQSQAEVAEQIAKANTEARATEQKLNARVTDLSTQLVKVQDDAKKQIAKLNSDLVSNKLQFYVKVKPSTNCPSSTPAPAGANQTDVAQLDTSTATALVNITAQGDEGITRLNACVAFYNQIRSMINASPNSR